MKLAITRCEGTLPEHWTLTRRPVVSGDLNAYAAAVAAAEAAEAAAVAAAEAAYAAYRRAYAAARNIGSASATDVGGPS
jgi:alkylhydroperoxidase/carboxymuconolactone decarboxylase family protein YurZ